MRRGVTGSEAVRQFSIAKVKVVLVDLDEEGLREVAAAHSLIEDDVKQTVD